MSNTVTKKGLILADNICVGFQLLTLLKKKGWQMQVIHQDKQAYERILKGDIDVVIADIEASRLGGLAVLTYCKRHWPAISTYAISPRTGEPYLKSLAQDMGGCRGFFYLSEGRLEIDTRIGMAAQLISPHTTGVVRKKPSATGKSARMR